MQNIICKSGNNMLTDNKENSELEEKVAAVLITLIEKAAKLGVYYSKKSGRNNLSSTDLIYALKYYAHEFDNQDNLETDFENNRSVYKNMMETDTDLQIEVDSSDSDTDSETPSNDEENLTHAGSDADSDTDSDTDSETDSNIQDEEFIECIDESDEIICKMNAYHANWDTWKPERETQKMIKNAVDKTISTL